MLATTLRRFEYKGLFILEISLVAAAVPRVFWRLPRYSL